MSLDSFSFLDSWTLVLPDRFPCVLAVAGRGAKTTLLGRLAAEYGSLGRRVLATRSAPGPALSAPELLPGPVEVPVDADLHALARQWGADVVVVEAQASCGSLLWPDGDPPQWPVDVDLAFSCMNLAALGRLWTAEVVHEAPDLRDEQRRVEVQDFLDELGRHRCREGRLPSGTAWIPFLSGFGTLRDIDAMFALGTRLVDELGARIVCFGELLGDVRRDAADVQGVRGTPVAADFLAGDRIYAVHPDQGPDGLADPVPTA